MYHFINSIEDGVIVAVQKYLSNPLLDWFFPFYTDLHKESWFISSFFLPLILLWFYFESDQWKKRFWIIGGFFITLIITDAFCGQLIKKTFQRARPFELTSSIVALSPASGYSFVSNHAANSIAMAVYLSYYYPKYNCVFWSLAMLTSFSRVYNGVHYPSDVIVGGLIGLLISKMVIKFIIDRKVVKA
jgi:undecaprenyl-diphosphatase